MQLQGVEASEGEEIDVTESSLVLVVGAAHLAERTTCFCVPLSFDPRSCLLLRFADDAFTDSYITTFGSSEKGLRVIYMFHLPHVFLCVVGCTRATLIVCTLLGFTDPHSLMEIQLSTGAMR